MAWSWLVNSLPYRIHLISLILQQSMTRIKKVGDKHESSVIKGNFVRWLSFKNVVNQTRYEKETYPQNWNPELTPIYPPYHLNSVSIDNWPNTCLHFCLLSLITIFLVSCNTHNLEHAPPVFSIGFLFKKWPTGIFFPDMCFLNSHTWFLWAKASRKSLYLQ